MIMQMMNSTTARITSFSAPCQPLAVKFAAAVCAPAVRASVSGIRSLLSRGNARFERSNYG